MWQIMWMLGLIPTWLWTVLLTFGIGCLIAAWFRTPWKTQLKIGGFAAVIISTWFLGMAANESKWQEKVKDLEQQLAIAKQESQKENVIVQEKVVVKKEYVKGKTEYITKYLDREVVKKEEVIKYIENCPVPKELIDVHNAAAQMNREKQ